ncbi:transcription antitermination factor NusB [Ferviditalea candida]|uniref:Transcription antitermination protein NusB n=1 Tax=Ferviditalea candida TaxID=3108399 RepID=A0ABU5ZG13_9BACL|nr:transcription antitermination factor NusB [Paenibacillaceae bacterium T2]
MRRRQAREMAVQSLYQMEMNNASAAEAVSVSLEEARLGDEYNLSDVSNAELGSTAAAEEYIMELVAGASAHREAIDGLLKGFLTGWQVDRLSRVDRQILRLAVYEMVYRDDVPPKVVINEAIEIAKRFGTKESGKFVNGVLGRLIKDLDQIKSKSSN